jgi:hypothetical protein
MADLAVYKVPSLAELFDDNLELAFKNQQLHLLLSKEPKPEWVKVNKFANNSRYLPIDKVEYLLKMIFPLHRIEILDSKTAFNAVTVVVRVHYFHPITQTWEYHDGIGAEALQVDAGGSASDLTQIKKGAVAMAFPIAKSYAIKDACHHFGNLFGANLNRKDVTAFTPDDKILNKKQQQEQEYEDLKELYESKKESINDPVLIANCERIIGKKEHKSYANLRKDLAAL